MTQVKQATDTFWTATRSRGFDGTSEGPYLPRMSSMYLEPDPVPAGGPPASTGNHGGQVAGRGQNACMTQRCGNPVDFGSPAPALSPVLSSRRMELKLHRRLPLLLDSSQLPPFARVLRPASL